MKNLIFTFAILFSSNAFCQTPKLSDCGRVIGHEMGLWEFFASVPGPDQVDRVLKSKLKFVKISLRKLKDGTWVVNHDDAKTIYPAPAESQNVKLSELTWQDVETLKAVPGALIPIYRLQEYIERDHGQLCWVFSPKVTIDEALIQQILQLQIADRNVLLTTSLAEVEFLAKYPSEDHLHFAGRVGANVNDLKLFTPYVGKLWAMEIDPTPNAALITTAAHQMGFKAYTDSMRYSWNYELFATACQKVFAMGSDYTQSNRPLQCIEKMKF